MKQLELFKEENKCGGSFCQGKNPGDDDHTCPYQSEINDDNESLCNCCADCSYECALAI